MTIDIFVSVVKKKHILISELKKNTSILSSEILYIFFACNSHLQHPWPKAHALGPPYKEINQNSYGDNSKFINLVRRGRGAVNADKRGRHKGGRLRALRCKLGFKGRETETETKLFQFTFFSKFGNTIKILWYTLN